MTQARPEMTNTWKFLNSLWIVLTFIPIGLTCYGAFFYIGIRANQKKWVIIGFVYLALIMLSFYLISAFDDEHFLTDIGVVVILFTWFSSIFFSFAVRNQYLRIIFKKKVQYERGLSTMAMNKVVDKEEIEQKQQRPKETPQQDVSKQPLGKIEPAKKVTTTSPTKVININHATENQIRALPSVHSFLAKNIIKVRKKNKPFRSIEDIAQAVGIQPHILDKAAPYIAFTNKQVEEKRAKLDDTKNNEHAKQSGRLVDY